MKILSSVVIATVALGSSLLLITGCANNGLSSLGDPPGVSADSSYSTASLSGVYSYNESGNTSGVLHDGSGALHFDGNGNVTGTVTDYYVGAGSCTFSIAGTYSVASSAAGTGTVTTSSTNSNCAGGTFGVSLQVGQQGQSFVFAESDGLRQNSGGGLKQ